MVDSVNAIGNIYSRRRRRKSKVQKLYNILLVFYTVLFLADHSLPAFYAEDWIGRLEIFTGTLLLILTVIKFLKADATIKGRWLKSYTLVFIYLALRIITFIRLGFEYSIGRTIFFEGVYLLTISEYITDAEVIKKYVLRVTVYWTLVLNILNVVFYKIMLAQGSNSRAADLLGKYTFLKGVRYYPSSTMYPNPNTFGIMTGISIIFLLIILKDSPLSKKTKYILFGAFLIFSIYCLDVAECNTANLALAAVLVLVVINYMIKNGEAKKFETLAVFVLILVVNAGILGFIYAHVDQGLFSIDTNESEQRLNKVSSDRYFILKSGIMSHKGQLLLGCGSLKNEIDSRMGYALDEFEKLPPKQQEGNAFVARYRVERLGPHNGYAGMIFATGYITAAVFFLLLFMRMKKSGVLNKGYWYMPVVYILIVNCFESMFVLNRYVLCLYLLMMINMRNSDNRQEV